MAEQSKSEADSLSVRSLTVMEVLADAGRNLSVAEISARAGIPRATAHRLCARLVESGYLSPAPKGGGLTIGGRLRNLALGIVAADTDQAYRHRVLTDLSRKIGETCNFNVPWGGDMYYVDRVETEWPLRTQMPVGSRVPLHCTASGKMYLASLPAAQRRKVVNAMDLAAFTSRTITDPDALLKNLDSVRRQRVGSDDQEFIEGMVAIAVPVTDAKGRLAATLACHGPTVRLSLDKAMEYLPLLNEAAEKLSASVSEDSVPS